MKSVIAGERESKKDSKVITSHKAIKDMLLSSLGFDKDKDVVSNEMCNIELHDGACYVAGKGFSGARVSMALPHAYRLIDMYEAHAQPMVTLVSLFNPDEKVDNKTYENICANVVKNKKGVMRMTQKALMDKDSDVSQFFAHYGKISNTRNMYKRNSDGKGAGALCIWSSPDVSSEKMSAVRDVLSQISEINNGASDDGSGDMCDEEYSDTDDNVSQSKALNREDETLQKKLLSTFNSALQSLRNSADDFNRTYAFALCRQTGIPHGTIADHEWDKLYTTKACNISNIEIEGDRLVASLNENRCKEGHAIIFHSPESGSTLYDLNHESGSKLGVSCSLGRNTQTEDKSPPREVMSHGIQIPPVIDGISSNRYATNEAPNSYKEEMVHRDAWLHSNEVHHISSEFYLSGAPHPVGKEGITDEAGLRLFLDNLVLDEHHEPDENVYVPDKNQVVCDIIRKAHPSTWLEVITSDSSVKNDSGSIIGWNIPLDKLAQV